VEQIYGAEGTNVADLRLCSPNRNICTPPTSQCCGSELRTAGDWRPVVVPTWDEIVACANDRLLTLLARPGLEPCYARAFL
jgi:hypothetical protein